MRRIDAHAHVSATAPGDGRLVDELDLKLLNICLAPVDPDGWRQHQQAAYAGLATERPHRWAWCTSFLSPDPLRPDPAYAEQVIADLERDFAAGAVAVKIWKNVGMHDKTPDGRYLQVDDPVFEPIYAWLARTGRPLLMHIAEPMACWLPLDSRSPHYSYYRDHPEWHMCGREGFPSHAAIISARDTIMGRHPQLRVIGAHFGSMEYDLHEVARRLDAFPNFAIDTSARLADFAMHDRSQAIDFLSTYADRVIWGTDLTVNAPRPSETAEQRQGYWESLRAVYQTEIAFYTTGGEVRIGDCTYHGLDLPPVLQDKLFCRNAQAWYPGL